jgi:hypothetical protein
VVANRPDNFLRAARASTRSLISLKFGGEKD